MTATEPRAQTWPVPSRVQPFDHLGQLAHRVLGLPWVFVEVLDGRGSFVVCAQDHRFPASSDLRAMTAESFGRRVAGSGGTLIVPDVELDPCTRGNPWWPAMGIRAVAAMPLYDPDGAVLGSFCVGDTTPRTWSQDDLELVRALADTAASKALLQGDVRRSDETAALLQHSMLTDLPALTQVQLVSRYLPAQDTEQIGGDWYDAFVLPDGVTALVIGDVAGHDLPAAARMGQLRNLLRGIAWHNNPTPHELLSGLDGVVFGLEVAELATVIYGRLEEDGAAGWRLRWANAGHPPPLLCTVDGDAEYLEEPSGLLIGFGDGTHEDGLISLPPLSTLLLFTDGLVESRGLDIGVGLERLRSSAQAAAALPLPEFCDRVLGHLADHLNEDDVTLLAVRIPAVAGRIA